MSRSGKHALLVLLVGSVLLGLLIWLFPVAEWLVSFAAWARANPLLSMTLYVLAYVVVTVLMAPGWILTVTAGYLYGWLIGTALVSIASLGGAVAAFLVGRTLAREWVAARVSDFPRFNALDRAIGQKGFLVVLLTRLSVVLPYNLLNYIYGLTRVRFAHYVLATWLGMLPVIAMYVFAGATAEDILELARGEAEAAGPGIALSIAAVVAISLVVVVLTRTANKMLEEDLGEDEPGSSSPH